MKFSIAVIALVASTTYALPQGQSQWSNWSSTSAVPQGSPIPTANNDGQSDHVANGGQPVPAPTTPQGPKNSGQSQPADRPKTTFVPAASPQPESHNAVANPAPAGSPTPSPTLPDQKGAQNSPVGDNDDTSPKPAATPNSNSDSAPNSNTGSDVGSNSGSGQSSWTRWRRANFKVRNNEQPDRQQQQQQQEGQQQGQPQQKTPSSSPAAPQGSTPSSKASPSPDPTFQTPADNVMSKLGSNPSDTCTWEFILTCANQAVAAGSTCLAPLAEA